MHGDQHDAARGEATGLRGMREAMRESADVLKCAAIAHDDHTDVDLSGLSRNQDLQAAAFRLREALQDAIRHGDENFYRLLDVQEEVRSSQEEVRGLQEEVRGSQEEVRSLQEEVRSSQEEVRGLREEVRDRDARIDSLACELDAAHARDAAQQARHEAISRARSAELAQWQACDTGSQVTAEHFLQQRSEQILKRIAERTPAFGAIVKRTNGWKIVAVLLPVLGASIALR